VIRWLLVMRTGKPIKDTKSLAECFYLRNPGGLSSVDSNLSDNGLPIFKTSPPLLRRIVWPAAIHSLRTVFCSLGRGVPPPKPGKISCRLRK
jgi:hypothetical protein